jgi:uncharacterized protein (TIGR02300 family)
VGKVDLGMKLTCESCAARFYDLGKQPAICPKCGAQNQRPQVFRSRRPSEEAREKRAAIPVAAVKKPVDEPTAEPDGDAEEEEDVIEDTSDLGEDDEVEVVVEKDEPT